MGRIPVISLSMKSRKRRRNPATRKEWALMTTPIASKKERERERYRGGTMEGGKGERERGEEEEPSMASQLLRRASKCPNQGIRREEKGPLHYLGRRKEEEGEREEGGARRSQPAIYRRDDPIPMPRKERRNSMASEEGPPLIKKSTGWSRERKAPNG